MTNNKDNKDSRSFEEMLEDIAKLSVQNGQAKVEPSAGWRMMAREIREAQQAFINEGFNRHEALMLASIPMREAAQYQFRKGDEK